MRTRWSGLLVCVLLVSGCEKTNPTTGRLAVGADAMIYNGAEVVVGIRGLMDGSSVGDGKDVAPAGLRVRVIGDEFEAKGNGDREVRVLLLEGEHKDQPVLVWRKELRLIPAR